MNTVITKFAPVVGRFLLALIFLLSGIGKIGAFAATAAGMAKMGIPLAEVALVVTIIIEIGGAAMLILGWQAWLGATALFLWMIPVTFLYHNFWAVPPEQFQLQQIMFMKNLAIMGGLLYVMSFGSGGYSLDRK